MNRGDLTEAEWRVLMSLLPLRLKTVAEAGRQLSTASCGGSAAALHGATCRPNTRRNTIYRRFRRWSEAGVWETIAVTLAEVMADSAHYSIDSTTVRAHVSAAGGKEGLIDALSAARGESSVSFTAWPMASDDRSPSI